MIGLKEFEFFKTENVLGWRVKLLILRLEGRPLSYITKVTTSLWMVRKILGWKINPVNGLVREKKNKKIRKLTKQLIITSMIKSRKVRCARYVASTPTMRAEGEGYTGTIFKPGVHFTRHFLTRFYNEENHLGNQFGEIKPELNYISCHFFLIFFLFDAGGNISDRLLLRNHKQQTTQYWNNTKIQKTEYWTKKPTILSYIFHFPAAKTTHPKIRLHS